ncbi:glycosyltransferase family 2 protein [Leuconostoc mesenteroides]|uniref:glycosyltransferase family 2 protein n=1 Tax=Leuconostoc mesenteroides TaxID=1245 RepID=UPI003CF43EB7
MINNVSSTPFFSIIMPVFNVENYISEAVESVLNQSYTNIELILINDGSTDDSSNIINDYLKTDHRIIIVNQNNKGLSEARNSGLKVATGKYVMFMDSDDIIDFRALQTVYEKVSFESTDVAMIGYQIFDEKKIFRGKSISNGFYSGQEIMHSILNHKLENYAWQFVINRSLLCKNLLFKRNVFYEDIDWTPRLLSSIDNVYYVGGLLYYYRKRRESITHSISYKKISDLEIVMCSMYCTIKKRFPDEFTYFLIWRKSLDLTIFYNYSKLGWASKKKKNEMRDKIQKYSNEGLSYKEKLKKFLIKYRIIDILVKIIH